MPNMVDPDTRYGERVIRTIRSAEEMKQHFYCQWFYNHGAPSHFSADVGFSMPILHSFLHIHSITIHPRPSRSYKKSGLIEHNHGEDSTILDLLQKSDYKGIRQVILARASFITNLISVSKVLSSFELARGYITSILGFPIHIVSEDLFNAHIERESDRELGRIIRSKASN